MIYHVSSEFEKGPEHKLNRAKEHLRNLYAEINSAIEKKPYYSSSYFNSDGSLYIGEIKVAFEPPIERWALIVGDVVHNLRSALDHIACRLVVANGGQITKQTAFPIGETAHRYKSARLRVEVGMSGRALRYIDLMKPYGGGYDLFWRLHRLDIEDKHRLLMPVLITPFGGTLNPAVIDGEDVPMEIADPVHFPIKDGTMLFRVKIPPHLRNKKVDMDFKLDFRPEFWSPKIVKAMSIEEALNPLVALVEKTIRILNKLL